MSAYTPGQKVGEWTILRECEKVVEGKNRSHVFYDCRCSCGAERRVKKWSLDWGKSRSCGHSSVNKRHDLVMASAFQGRKGLDSRDRHGRLLGKADNDLSEIGRLDAQ
jgi:hypothetical protein